MGVVQNNVNIGVHPCITSMRIDDKEHSYGMRVGNIWRVTGDRVQLKAPFFFFCAQPVFGEATSNRRYVFGFFFSNVLYIPGMMYHEKY